MLVGKNKQLIRSFEEHKSETIDILIIGTARESKQTTTSWSGFKLPCPLKVITRITLYEKEF